MPRTIIILLAKLIILYLALALVWGDLIVLHTTLPKLAIFMKPVFVQAWALVFVLGVPVSVMLRSRTPILAALICPAFAGAYHVYPQHATAFVAVFSLVAGISLIYRNKITEPFLIMLPVIVGAWLFLNIEAAYFVGWVPFVLNKASLFEAIMLGFVALVQNALPLALAIPFLLMYILGSQSYLGWYRYWYARLSRSSTVA